MVPGRGDRPRTRAERELWKSVKRGAASRMPPPVRGLLRGIPDATMKKTTMTERQLSEASLIQRPRRPSWRAADRVQETTHRLILQLATAPSRVYHQSPTGGLTLLYTCEARANPPTGGRRIFTAFPARIPRPTRLADISIGIPAVPDRPADVSAGTGPGPQNGQIGTCPNHVSPLPNPRKSGRNRDLVLKTPETGPVPAVGLNGTCPRMAWRGTVAGYATGDEQQLRQGLARDEVGQSASKRRGAGTTSSARETAATARSPPTASPTPVGCSAYEPFQLLPRRASGPVAPEVEHEAGRGDHCIVPTAKAAPAPVRWPREARHGL